MSRLITCALLLAALAVMGRPFESGYSNDNGVIRVSVFIDLSKEGKIKFPEGTAMLRANRLLHKACPELPAKYSVTGRVLTNSHNRVEKTYSYVVEYDPQSIDAVVKQAAIDAEKAREAARLAAEKLAAEKAAAKKLAAEQQSLQEVDTVGKTGDKSPDYGAAKTNGTADVQNLVTNTTVQSSGVCADEPKTNNITGVSEKMGACEADACVTNAPSVKTEAGPGKTVASPVRLTDMTVKDIKEKMVKPKVTEKNGFKQIDVDSFGGIDPMEK